MLVGSHLASRKWAIPSSLGFLPISAMQQPNGGSTAHDHYMESRHLGGRNWGNAHLARCPSAGIATVASPFPHRRPSRRLGRDKRGPSRKWYSNCFAIVLVRSRFAVRAPCAHQQLAKAPHKANRRAKTRRPQIRSAKGLRLAQPFPAPPAAGQARGWRNDFPCKQAAPAASKGANSPKTQ